jgi:hypothetical protein
MKKIAILIILCFCISCSIHGNPLHLKSTPQTTRFIVIANVGSSNYYIAPLVISTDSILKIPHTKGIFDVEIKYKGFRNIVVSSSEYEKLFSHLNMYQECNKRPERFIRDVHSILIIDYRNESEVDCELLTMSNIPIVLYTLNNIYCYLLSNNFNHNVIDYVKIFYKFYLDTYDRNRDSYTSEISCK